MGIKVLIVDDSHFFRRCIGEIVTKADGLEVLDYAKNGQEGVEKALSLKPDVVMMDIEMPVKNGIDATREIMSKQPMPILMFSSLTHEGAKATLDALDAGAADFLPKKFEEIAGSGKVASELITKRIKAIARRTIRTRPAASPASRPPPSSLRSTTTTPLKRPLERTPTTNRVNSRAVDRNASVTKASGKRYNMLAIASSTGGPVALQAVLSKLPANFPYPILLVQHMPGAFTGAFAERLDRLCKIKVKEATNGDIVKPGHAYLAPGGMQMLFERGNRLKVTEGPSHLNYKPCADVSFASIAKNHEGNVMTLVLTGMGADGCDGAKLLNTKGATVWAQDEATSVVYGMPQAVKRAGLTSKVLPLETIGESLVKEMLHG
ncbi:chemotaxis response regulator protein-glutamate methylesterase [Psychrobium sp. 1_MG-2023]|uniref:protein-glutamate methylesterase/protein-glutamine glutaminase n=1 Tax=Psychrobium sp. 1_MG-2023 TaxID=3062624 RepID=UPI000C33B4A4|nr:chemotaxis response regulator protein-glutamate methylesterase [Psychrobium sp. 1_MG-2023]MDP2559817.1 chemotaxis response regulator protein-glutamate methylesterase [Psychrobium sp. 1_MG-2023]PKF59077.1 chemotaxis response regulator protein-glutamate methylesterase [Alteromonadales bacterium alter-6D02]